MEELKQAFGVKTKSERVYLPAISSASTSTSATSAQSSTSAQSATSAQSSISAQSGTSAQSATHVTTMQPHPPQEPSATRFYHTSSNNSQHLPPVGVSASTTGNMVPHPPAKPRVPRPPRTPVTPRVPRPPRTPAPQRPPQSQGIPRAAMRERSDGQFVPRPPTTPRAPRHPRIQTSQRLPQGTPVAMFCQNSSGEIVMLLPKPQEISLDLPVMQPRPPATRLNHSNNSDSNLLRGRTARIRNGRIIKTPSSYQQADG